MTTPDLTPPNWPQTWPAPAQLLNVIPGWLDLEGIQAAGEIFGRAGVEPDPIAFAQMTDLCPFAPVELAGLLVELDCPGWDLSSAT